MKIFKITALTLTLLFSLNTISQNKGSITFPAEIRNYLKNKKIKITHISKEDFKSLPRSKTAIVLISKKGSFTSYHWACWPVTKNVHSFFGKDSTIIHRVILLERL